MKIHVTHTTQYQFDGPVTFGLQQLRVTPKSFANQKVLSWKTTLTGGTRELISKDWHGNEVELISFTPKTTEVSVTAEGEVEVTDTGGVLGPHRGVPLWLYERTTDRTRPGKGVAGLVAQLPSGSPLEQLHALSALIRERVTYEVGSSAPDWGAEEALAQGRGVCQDHTHIFVTCARKMGVPARYVSGYLLMDDREDQTATHAWAEAHVPDLGWVGFDVSNGISPDHRYVRVATGLDYGSAAPVRGSRTGAVGEHLMVQLRVAQQQ